MGAEGEDAWSETVRSGAVDRVVVHSRWVCGYREQKAAMGGRLR